MCEKCENTELRREIEALTIERDVALARLAELTQELAAKTELAESLNRLAGTLREENKRLREELEGKQGPTKMPKTLKNLENPKLLGCYGNARTLEEMHRDYAEAMETPCVHSATKL